MWPVLIAALLGIGAGGCAETRASARSVSGIHKIKHVVIIMQENRSFDSYFGTYPGADGIPRRHGRPTVCIPDPATGNCVKPYHDRNDVNAGGAHTYTAALTDIDGGKMDGFIRSVRHSETLCSYIQDPNCETGSGDVMGYHTGAEIPNYWSYAKHFVLQDHMFESTDSWSLPAHLYMVSGWSASCALPNEPRSCRTDVEQDNIPHPLGPRAKFAAEACGPSLGARTCQIALRNVGFSAGDLAKLERLIGARCRPESSAAECVPRLHAGPYLLPRFKLFLEFLVLPEPDYAWTDLTYLLHKHHVSWRYYVASGLEPDCENGGASGSKRSGPSRRAGQTCVQKQQSSVQASIWNPLPDFTTVQRDHQVQDVKPLARFYRAATKGTLPAVSWIIPSQIVSEHPPGAVSAGQAYVTGLINAIMRGPDWDSTAIFVSWDDWGGFYDHVTPPRVDGYGYGIRVPGLVISAYAKRGYIDHQTLSFDAYIKFIEDDFLGGQRLNPKTDGRPDSRPDVREKARQLGNLVRDFNFSQAPRRPVILPHGKAY